jgi:hypothetical protein
MPTSGTDDLQRDDEMAATDEDAASAAARAERLEIHTHLPGIVKSFDRTTLTAKVQPAIKRLWREAGFLPLPELVDCPYQMLRAGNIMLWMEPSAGDECLVSFSERAIDNWHHAGGVQEPSEYRLHDLSDGFAAPGFWSKPEARKITNPPPAGAVELRTLDGATVVRLEAGLVTLGSAAGAQPAVKGDILATVLEAIKQHTHPCTGGTTSPSVELAVPAAMPDPRSSKVKVS